MKKITALFGIHAFAWACVILMSSMELQSQTLYVPSGTSGIGSSSTSNVGIGVSAPLSKLSVGSTGDASSAGYFYNATTVNNYCYGLVGQSAPNTSWSIGFKGASMPNSSSDRAYGVVGTSYNNTSLSNGRTYGISGWAGNATSGWNYAVHGRLLGTNNGAAIFGTVSNIYGEEEDTGGQYAGYFKGSVYMNSQLSIGYKTASYMLDVNGYIRGYNLTPSDERLKKNVKELKGSLASLTNLHGVTYSLKTDGMIALSKKQEVQAAVPDTGKVKTTPSYTTDPALYNRTHIGLLAQEVQKVFPELVHTDADGIMSVDYVSLIPVLIESIKELNDQIAELKSTSTSRSSEVASTKASSQSNAILYQNTPNPFNQNTTIAYYLPETITKASLNIYNMQGSQIKVLTVTERGNGNVMINSGELSAGMYMYTLIVDGKEVDTKRMILTD